MRPLGRGGSRWSSLLCTTLSLRDQVSSARRLAPTGRARATGGNNKMSIPGRYDTGEKYNEAGYYFL